MVLGAPALAERGVATGGSDVNLPVLHRLEFESPLSVDAAAAAISSRTEPRNWFRMQFSIGFWTLGWKGDDQYEGQTLGSEFHIVRIMGYQNMFAPELHGTIHRHGKGSRILIELRPQMFAVVMNAIVLAFFVIAAIGAYTDGGVSAMPGFFLVLVFWPAIASFAFWFEVWKQTPNLREIFQAN